jgi:hypothetical protein
VACVHCTSCRALALSFMWQIHYYISPIGTEDINCHIILLFGECSSSP